MKREVVIRCKGARLLAIDDMYPIQGNLKDLSEARYKKLKKEILELGYSEPISVWFDKKTKRWCILNGTQRHRTLRMMRDEGYKIPLIPVAEIQADSLDEARRKILALTSQYGEMTEEGLYEFLHEANIPIAEVEASFEFAEIDMEHFKASYYEELAGGVVEDEVPKTRKTNIKLGDLYQLGSHRLLCGDSTNVVHVERLLEKSVVDMVFTSPPYNANTKFTNVKNSGKLYENYDDNKSEGDYLKLCHAVLENCFQFLDGFLFWNVNYNSNTRAAFLKQTIPYLDKLVETICWKKTALPVPHGLTRTWEPIFVFSTSAKEKRIGHANQTEFNFWDISNSGALDDTHRAAFPVALPLKAMELCEPTTVFDPFCGSGTTLIACERTKRHAYGMELDPQYCQVIIDRWEKISNTKAIKIK